MIKHTPVQRKNKKESGFPIDAPKNLNYSKLMLDELNLLESKLNKLIETIEVLKKENDELKPNLHLAKEEIQNLKTKMNEATLKVENLLGQLPS